MNSSSSPLTTIQFSILVVFLTTSIYFLRYAQVYGVRKQICSGGIVKIQLQPKEDTVQQQVFEQRSQYTVQLRIPQEYLRRTGGVITVIGTVDHSMQCEQSEKIVLNIQSISRNEQTSVSENSRIFQPVHLLQKHLTSSQVVFERRVRSYLTAAQADVLLGVVFGRRPEPKSSVKQAFSATGVQHILVASGANIAFITILIRALMRKTVSRKIVFIATVIGIFLYAEIVGYAPPMLRALFFTLWILLHAAIGRRSHVFFTLWFSISFLLIYQPFLIYSVSFWLSVAATVGLVVAQLYRNTNRLAQLLVQNFIIFLATLPIILFLFQSAPFTGIVLTPILSLFVSALLTVGIGAYFMILLHLETVGAIFLFVSSLLSECIVRLVNLFSTFPQLEIHAYALSFQHALLLYFTLVVAFFSSIAIKNNKR